MRTWTSDLFDSGSAGFTILGNRGGFPIEGLIKGYSAAASAEVK
jgi:hypothetical protein